MTTTFGRPGLDWTVVLRRQPARIVAGQVVGGYTSMFEIICCDCGDDPDLAYGEVSLMLQQIRGPYPVAAGIAAYGQHLTQHKTRRPAHRPGRLDEAARERAGSARPGEPGMMGAAWSGGQHDTAGRVRDHGKPHY